MNSEDSTKDSAAVEKAPAAAAPAESGEAVQAAAEQAGPGAEARAERSEAEPPKGISKAADVTADEAAAPEAASAAASKTSPGADEGVEEGSAEEDAEPDEDELDSEEEAEPEVLAGTDDPLAPGFDLDQGEPIDSRGAGQGRLPWRSEVGSPKEFFNSEILYRFDIIEPEDRPQMEGTVRIELRGQQGGVWTLKIGEDLVIVNSKEDADCVLNMQQKDFMEVINGVLNPQLAILSQKMTVTGDLRRALAVQSLLTPSQE